LAAGPSDHGKAARSPRQKRAKRAATSANEVGEPQSSRASLRSCLRLTPKPSKAPKAGDRESPQRPLGNSSQDSVRARYDLARFAQKIGRVVSVRRDGVREGRQGRGLTTSTCGS
jgi:hypothetical protein